MNASTFFSEVFVVLGSTAGAIVVGMLINHWRISRRYYPRDYKWSKSPHHGFRDSTGANKR